MKKILVPTDFSEQAEHALKVAAEIARNHDSDIYLLHMLELPLQGVDAYGSHNELPEAIFFMKMAQKQFDSVLEKDYLQNLTVHQTIKADLSFSEIRNTCDELSIDLIVMGSHGTSGLSEVFIGSNAEKVVRNSKVPVLVIKNNHENFFIDNFVFASDFKDESKTAYKQAVNFAKKFDATIHLLMVNTPNNFRTTHDAKARINEFTKDEVYFPVSVNIYNDESVEQGILNFSKEINADLIGISTHGRQGIAHFFNGSISEDIVNHATRPVITFKIK
jgi:nucleotide-binding universal stress UspA family protein